jgi:hypothetical protein
VPTYNQIGEVFMAQLSVIDLLFNVDLEDIARMLSHNNG